MPRFHFNVYDGVAVLDPEGIELTDNAEARIEAVRLAGEIVKDNTRRLILGDSWQLEVVNEHGLILYRIYFSTPGNFI